MNHTEGTVTGGGASEGVARARRVVPPRGTYWALHVTASFFDRVVQEATVPHGRSVRLGRGEDLDLPVPAGSDAFAVVTWRGPTTAAVTDHRGRQVLVEPDQNAEIQVGPVVLELRLVRRYSLRRTGFFWWLFACTFAMLFFAFGITASQWGTLHNNRCDWFPPYLRAIDRVMDDPEFTQSWIYCPNDQHFSAAQPSNNSAWTAEYLQRLLRKDYDGDAEEVGYIDKPTPREIFEKKPDENDQFLPAGSDGPTTEMGGARKKAPEPVRTPDTEVAREVVKKREAPQLVADDGEEKVVVPDLLSDADVDAADDPEDDAEDDADEAARAPADDKEGWGIPDWYDVDDLARDRREIDLMLQVAKLRLRLDPDDVDALALMSYYQYLAMDLDGALGTYDKIIELAPDESAGYNNKALVYKRQGRYKEEEDLYRIALTLEPDDATARNNLAVNLSHQGRFQEALAVMDALLLEDPGDPYGHLHRAKIFAEMGDDAKALQYLELALQGMAALDTLHHIEFRQDIRVDPSFARLRDTPRFRAILWRYYGKDTPVPG